MSCLVARFGRPTRGRGESVPLRLRDSAALFGHLRQTEELVEELPEEARAAALLHIRAWIPPLDQSACFK